MSSFAENIKKIRLEKQMSQEEFAKLLGTSKQNISRYESGEVSPKISTAARIAEILNISLSELNGDMSQMVGKREQASGGHAPVVDTSPWDSEFLAWAGQDDDMRVFARGMSKLSKEKRAQLLRVARAMFAEDFDEEGNKKNDT